MASLVRSFGIVLLANCLLAVGAMPFVAINEIGLAIVLACMIALVTETPLFLLFSRQNLTLTLAVRLVAMLMRIVCAVVCVFLFAATQTEAFILIFSLSLSLTIITDAFLISGSQEPVHD